MEPTRSVTSPRRWRASWVWRAPRACRCPRRRRRTRRCRGGSFQHLPSGESVQLAEEGLEILGTRDTEVLHGGSFEDPWRISGLAVAPLPVFQEEALHDALGGLVIVLGLRGLTPVLLDG